MQKKQPRKEQTGSTRDRILEAAEHLFGEYGYDATSIRDIAMRAEVRIGLVSYYFESKEVLYEKIIERRSAEIGRRRLDALARERKEAAPKPIPIDGVIRAYALPFLELSHAAGPAWKSYTKIISSVANSRRWASLISDYYDPVATTFLGELQRTFPSCSKEKLVTGFTFVVSVMLGVAAETGRADQLSDGLVSSADIERISGLMTPFLSGGFQALAQSE